MLPIQFFCLLQKNFVVKPMFLQRMQEVSTSFYSTLSALKRRGYRVGFSGVTQEVLERDVTDDSTSKSRHLHNEPMNKRKFEYRISMQALHLAFEKVLRSHYNLDFGNVEECNLLQVKNMLKERKSLVQCETESEASQLHISSSIGILPLSYSHAKKFLLDDMLSVKV